MFAIRNNEMRLTRGDTAIFQIMLDGYKIKETDEVVFSVKKKITDQEYTLQKNMQLGCFILEAEDTAKLEPGIYDYDIQITTAENVVYTPVKSKITIMRGVTE